MFQRSSRLINHNYSKSLIFRSPRYFSTEQLDLAIIGGGPGGYACAIKAAQLGLKTTCIEGRGTLGGTCLNVGCIPSKALLHNSHLYHEAKHSFAKRGIIIEGNVSLDLNALMKIKSDSVNGLTKGIEGLFKKNKVIYTKGYGKIKDKNTIEVTDPIDGKLIETINAKNIVIATGSDSTKIPGIDIDEKDIVSSTGALSFDKVPENLLVVGAGVIGLELGSVWSRLGSKVTVVEFLDRILPGVDKDCANKFQKMLQKQGIDFRLNEGVKSIDKSPENKLSVTTETNKDKKENISEYDKVLIAIGRIPYTENLGLDTMKIEMDDRQIKVNDNFQTSISNIYAIGDCIRGAMLAHKAEEEGIATAEIIAGKPGHVNYNAIPGVIYTYPEVASVGKTEEELKDEGIEYNKGEFPFLANSRARTNADSDGFVKILADKKTDRMLGVHIIGPNAGEMIAEGVIALEYGASAEDIARTCHAHPTLSEAFKEACMNACGMKAIHF